MAESARWIEGILMGEIALGLCVIAVAFVGALMLTGRLALRGGMRVMVGCFVLLGAQEISSGILNLGAGLPKEILPFFDTKGQGSMRPKLPEAHYNPYAQASVRED